GSARSPDPTRSPGTPAARSSGRSTADTPRPPDARQASPLFSQQVLQRDVVEHGVSQHPLELGVLVLQRLQTSRLRHVQPTILGLPLVESRRAEPVLPAQVQYR